MSRERKIFAAKCAIVMSVPIVLYAYATGPDPRKTGAPGDSLCTECHLGTANSVPGKVEVTFPNGLTYTPGQTQRLTVTVTDTAARVFGFQLTARLASNERSAQAGTFTPINGSTQVLCEDGQNKPAGGCRASAPLEFIEHTLAGASNTFTFDWTPPATDAGNVRIYVAGNGGNGDGTNRGDHIFTANYTVTPAAAGDGGGSNKPAMRAVQPVLQAFLGGERVSSGTWLEIYGTNLSTTTREWAGSDFTGNTAPKSLDGVGVKINGQDAFVRYVSPTQINVQAPDDNNAVGPVQVVVSNSNGSSAPLMVNKTSASPALLTTPAFSVGGKQYAAALFPDFQTFVGPANLIAGVPFRPAKPGDTIIVFAVGCGATNPPSAAGQFFPDARPLSSSYQVTFGQAVAQAQGFLAAGAVGLCQFNVTVPNATGDTNGDIRIDATVDGQSTGQNLYTNIQR